MNIVGLAYCGLFCNGCPIYWATKETDKEKQKKMRAKIAEISNEKYGTKLQYTDITDCEGCRSSSGKIFSGCANCEIRKCVREKNYAYCSQCPEYVCSKLQMLYNNDKDAEIWMDILREIKTEFI